MNLDRLITLLGMATHALASAIAVCFVGPGVTFVAGALFALWLPVWRREARR